MKQQCILTSKKTIKARVAHEAEYHKVLFFRVAAISDKMVVLYHHPQTSWTLRNANLIKRNELDSELAQAIIFILRQSRC